MEENIIDQLFQIMKTSAATKVAVVAE